MLMEQQKQWIQENEEQGLGISVISCWEVAKLVEYNRLTLPCSIEEWLEQAHSLAMHLLKDGYEIRSVWRRGSWSRK